MGTYAIGDVHGCYTEFMQLLDKIEKEDPDSKFILVGDIVDRGSETYLMCKWAMKNVTKDGKYQMVIGNHEKEKIDWLEYNKNELNYKGIEVTNTALVHEYTDRYNLYAQIDKYCKSDMETCNFIVKFIGWCKNLSYYKDIIVNNQRFIVVHANIPDSAIDYSTNTINKELYTEQKEYMVWSRDIMGFTALDDTILVHGHTPTVMAEAFPLNLGNDISDLLGKIVHTPNRYNIDCGLVYNKTFDKSNLAALRLDDLKEIYLYE